MIDVGNAVKICEKCGGIFGSCDKNALIHTGNNCGGNLIDTGLVHDELMAIRKVSSDNDFLKAMIELKKKDIIEYNLKMSQFKAQTAWQNQAVNRSSSTLRCPQCGSTNVSTGARGYSMLTGFAGAGKTVNRCGRCGYKWKPHGNYT